MVKVGKFDIIYNAYMGEFELFESAGDHTEYFATRTAKDALAIARYQTYGDDPRGVMYHKEG